MPSCRPQMLHQLQTSSFLRSPSFPALQPPRIERRGRERERQGEEEIYAVFKLTTSHCYSPLLPLLPILSFRSHLSTSSRTMTQVICKRKGGKGGRVATETRRHGSSGGPTRHEFSIKFNTRRERIGALCTSLFQVIESKAKDKERNKDEGGATRGRTKRERESGREGGKVRERKLQRRG